MSSLISNVRKLSCALWSPEMPLAVHSLPCPPLIQMVSLFYAQDHRIFLVGRVIKSSSSVNGLSGDQAHNPGGHNYALINSLFVLLLTWKALITNLKTFFDVCVIESGVNMWFLMHVLICTGTKKTPTIDTILHN